jgi:hypothetical protein
MSPFIRNSSDAAVAAAAYDDGRLGYHSNEWSYQGHRLAVYLAWYDAGLERGRRIKEIRHGAAYRASNDNCGRLAS